MTDFSHEAYMIQLSVCEMAGVIQHAVTAPHVLLRPRVFADGNMWCALLGDDLQVGVSGFGKTPQEACAAFDEAWRNGPTPTYAFAARKVLAVSSEMIAVLHQCEDYFDNKADADCDQDGFIPNEEMKLLSAVREAIAKAEGK